MDPYRLGTNADVLGACYDAAVVACTFVLLGSSGAVLLEMLVHSKKIELEGNRYSNRKLIRSSTTYCKPSHNCFKNAILILSKSLCALLGGTIWGVPIQNDIIVHRNESMQRPLAVSIHRKSWY